MTNATGERPRRRGRSLRRSIALRTPILGRVIRERDRLRMQRDALLQDAENLRIAVGQLLTEVHAFRREKEAREKENEG